jgi:hypothetical protein
MVVEAYNPGHLGGRDKSTVGFEAIAGKKLRPNLRKQAGHSGACL